MIKIEMLYAKSKDIVWKKVINKTIVLNRKTQDFFILDEAGGDIWQLINGKRNTAQIANMLSRAYDENLSDLKKSINTLIIDLNKKGLILKRR